MNRRLVISVVLLLLLCVAGLVARDALITERSNSKPWRGYAWSNETQKLRWWFDTFENQRDCLDAMANALSHPPYNASYSEPVGCVYHSNSYWRVWLMHGDKDFTCIWRSVEGEKDNAGYGPLLQGYPAISTDTNYCVERDRSPFPGRR
jgi:hypothetical protein